MNTNNIKKYLLGDNNKLIGTILFIEKNNSTNKEHAYSIYLYFNHLTARIERYLFNPDLTKPYKELVNEEFHKNNGVIQPYTIDKKLTSIVKSPNIYTLDYINTLKHYNIRYHLDTSVYSTISLRNGNINKFFNNIFYLELLHNYLSLSNPKHYLNPDITLIKYVELHKYLVKTGVDRNPKFNRENLLEIIKSIDVYPVLELNPNNTPYQIYIPHTFTTNFKKSYVKEELASMNMLFTRKSLSDMPECINDLKSQINDKTVTNSNDLRKLIIKFNETIPLKISTFK